jgi:hypothetical protein
MQRVERLGFIDKRLHPIATVHGDGLDVPQHWIAARAEKGNTKGLVDSQRGTFFRVPDRA